MNADSILQQLTELAETTAGKSFSKSSGFVGLFQVFRPDGIPEERLFDPLAGGEEFGSRLRSLYEAVRASTRTDGMRDAYFIVREPAASEPRMIGEFGERFAHGLIEVLAAPDESGSSSVPVRRPAIRVLEGKAPRHPKDKSERSNLLNFLADDAPAAMEARCLQGSLACELSEPLYFVACDTWLRDYLRWPLLRDLNVLAGHDASETSSTAQQATLESALDAYFELWRRGVKFRVFSDRQVDFYIPRSVA